jgi:hypothetical protein
MTTFAQSFKDGMLMISFMMAMWCVTVRIPELSARIQRLERNITLLNTEHPGYGYNYTFEP